jgi:uridine phosphorylase
VIAVDTQYPILEFDATPEAVLEPAKAIKDRDLPEHCVLCFFYDVMAKLRQNFQAEPILPIKSEMGKHPVYALSVEGQKLAVCHIGIGAPLAGAMLEELIARGGRKFIVCGVAAVLNRDIATDQVIVPSAAVRDEGTSYHYIPPAREVGAHPSAVSAIEAVLKKHRCPYFVGKT